MATDAEVTKRQARLRKKVEYMTGSVTLSKPKTTLSSKERNEGKTTLKRSKQLNELLKHRDRLEMTREQLENLLPGEKNNLLQPAMNIFRTQLEQLGRHRDSYANLILELEPGSDTLRENQLKIGWHTTKAKILVLENVMNILRDIIFGKMLTKMDSGNKMLFHGLVPKSEAFPGMDLNTNTASVGPIFTKDKK